MKVLYISTPAFADCDFPLIKAYQEKGVDITYLILIAPFSLKSTLFNIKSIFPKTGVFPVTVYPEIQRYANYMDMSKVYVGTRTGCHIYNPSTWRMVYELRKFVKNGEYDIVHTDTYFRGISRSLYSLANAIVTTIHDPFPHEGADSWDNRKPREVAVASSKGIVLLNKTQLSRFCEEYQVPSEKVLINSLGVYDIIRNFVKDEVPPKRNNILFFGRIAPYKGVEYLCEAMDEVRGRIPDATLTIAGGGKYYFDIETYAQKDYVEVLNHYITMEELARLLGRCQLSVCPYSSATQSGVIMTSFAMGKPVVATNVGALGEMVKDGWNGCLVAPRNAHALAEAIIELLTDDSRLSRMKCNILEEYRTGDRSWSSIAERYLAFYEQILNG